MANWKELVSYVGFTERDAAHLAAFWPAAKPHIEEVVEEFYSRVMAHDETREVIKSEAQMGRLRRSMAEWLEETLTGPHDEAYFSRRLRVGHRHVQVGLPHAYVNMAMAVIVEQLSTIALSECGSDALPVIEAIRRITTVDAAMMASGYLEKHEIEQLRGLQDLLISRLPVTVLLVDRDDRVISTTQPGYELFGHAAAIGHRWQEVLPGPLVDAAGLEAVVSRSRETGRDIALLRVDADFDGEERQFRLHVLYLAHEEADILVHIEELTDAIGLETRVARAESLAKLGELSAAVAHELRNPLAGISGAIQVLSTSLAEDDRRRGIMDKVQAQIVRLNRMVSDLLSFARPVETRVAVLDLAGVARQVADMVEGEVRVQGEGQATGDPHLVQQILMNLCANGLSAGTEVQVDVGPGRVEVADNGPGVPEDDRQRIFEPFVTTKTQGTGLGLAISQKSARSMGGSLVLAPRPSSLGGALFILTLPTASDEDGGA